ncbi:MAG: hypothetical protein ABI212_00030 [Burkholderiaceae bacterium]
MAEVYLSASALAYTLALPSQLTNIGVVSAKGFDPRFWGDRADEACTQQRLARLLLHTFGHLSNLPRAEDPANVMYAFTGVEDLDGMAQLTPAQRDPMRGSLPREAHQRTSDYSRWRFAGSMLVAD